MTHRLTRIAVVCLIALAAHVCARAQAAPTPPAPAAAAQGADAPRASADESFELNITERRITEEHFAASTAVELGGEGRQGVRLRVGVGVGAERIDVLLRNVRGSVRFRASLEELTRRLGAQRPAPPSP